MDKYDVMAKCEAIITRQIAHTSNPNVREHLHEIAYILAEPGYGESYRLVKYSDCITLINDNYQNEINFELYDKDLLLIGCFDQSLYFNDRSFVRIEPDKDLCYMAWNDHGTERGDAEMAKLKYDSRGKLVQYYIKGGKNSSNQSNGGRVVNNNGRGFLDRILHNETIGRLDYIIGLFSVLFIFGVIGNLFPLFGKLLGGILAVGGLLVMCFCWFNLNRRRYLDMNHEKGTATILAIASFLISPLFLYLILAPTKVRTSQEAAKDDSRESIARENARKALARRCNSIDSAPEWYRITPSERDEAMRIRQVQNPHTTPTSSMKKTREENDKTGRRDQQKRELEGKIKEAEYKISELENDIKRLEKKRDDERDEADDSRRNGDYDDANYHDQKADGYQRQINGKKGDLESEESTKSELEWKLSNLHANM